MVRMSSDVGRSSSRPRTPERPRCQRQRVVGVDLWVDCPSGWKQAVAVARCAATATHLRLAAVLEEHRYEGALDGGNEDGQLRLRFLARRDDVHVTDEAFWELLAQLPGEVRWSRLAKLEEFDGVPSFAPLPALP